MIFNFGLIVRELLNEGKRDNLLAVYLPLFQKRGMNVSLSQLKQALLAKFVNEASINALSLDSNYYLAGVARYYFNGDLTSNKRLGILYGNKDKFIPEVCQRLSALIEILRNAYIDSVGMKWEQPEDFGTLSISQLFRKYGAKINKALGVGVKEKDVKAEPEIDNDTTAGNNYTYEIIYTYDQAKKYKVYTDPGAWCITYAQQHFDAYQKRLGIHYIFFMRNGFENVERRVGSGFTKAKPHDEYGNSLIAVLQSNSSPEPIYITSRWNHGSHVDYTSGTEADHAYTTEEFLSTIGADYSVLERAFNQWKVMKPKRTNVDRSKIAVDRIQAMRKFKYAQMLLNSGQPFERTGLKLIGIINNINNVGRSPFQNLGLKGLCLVMDEDTNYATLMDNGKLKFDEFVSKANDRGYVDYQQQIIGNCVRFKTHQNDKWYLYDLRRHKFVDIDGVRAFKCISRLYDNYASNEYRYIYIGAKRNQISLFDAQSAKPIILPNGSPWFELAYDFDSPLWRRRVADSDSLEPVRNDAVLELIYDSASGEDYIYNVKLRKFTPSRIRDNNFGDFSVAFEHRYVPAKIGEYVVYSANNHDISHCYKYISTIDGSVLNLGGFDTFNAMNVSKNEKVVIFKPYGTTDVYIYNLAKNDFCRMNGEVFVLHTIRGANNFFFNDGYGKNLLMPIIFFNSWKQTLMYSPELNILAINKETNDIFFDYFGSAQGRVKVFNKDNSFRYLPSEQQFIEMYRQTGQVPRI